jgi:hypothetical protein
MATMTTNKAAMIVICKPSLVFTTELAPLTRNELCAISSEGFVRRRYAGKTRPGILIGRGHWFEPSTAHQLEQELPAFTSG